MRDDSETTMNREEVDQIRVWLQGLALGAVRISPTVFVRTYWDDLQKLREARIGWSVISQGLRRHGITFEPQQLESAWRNERARLAGRRGVPKGKRPKQAGLPTRSEPWVAEIRSTGAAPAARADDVSDVGNRAVAASQETSEPDISPAGEVSPGGLTVDEIAELKGPVAEVTQGLSVRASGAVFWDNGEPCRVALPARVLAILRGTGKFIPRSTGRTSNRAVAMIYGSENIGEKHNEQAK